MRVQVANDRARRAHGFLPIVVAATLIGSNSAIPQFNVASAAKRVALTFLLAGSVRGSAGTSFGARWIGATVVQNYLEGKMN